MNTSAYPDAMDAIIFTTDVLEDYEATLFLKDFRKSNLKPWPEFTEWLAKRITESNPNGPSHHLQAENRDPISHHP